MPAKNHTLDFACLGGDELTNSSQAGTAVDVSECIKATIKCDLYVPVQLECSAVASVRPSS